MSAWVAVAVIGLVSYAFRLGPVVVLQHLGLPDRVDRALTYAGPSAMVAITVSSITRHQANHGTPATVAAVVALVVAGGLAVRGRPLLAVVAAGTLVYAAALWVGGVPMA
jgi:branched-subunit amino acid transport protein